MSDTSPSSGGNGGSAVGDAAPSTTSAAAASVTSSTVSVTKENVHTLTFYELFQLDPNSSEIDANAIRRSYRRFSLLFHPDKDPSPEARDAFEVIKRAVDTLTDPVKRAEYDAEARKTEQVGKAEDATRDAMRRAHHAAEVLRQRESYTAAQAELARRHAEEREEAARRMRDELTHSLATPFRQMEAELVLDWDINEDLLEQKEGEIKTLLEQLASIQVEEAASVSAALSSSSSPTSRFVPLVGPRAAAWRAGDREGVKRAREVEGDATV